MPSFRNRIFSLPKTSFNIVPSFGEVMEKVIAIIDLKSFYASCECACRHLDIFTTPLVCVDPYRSENSVVMSVTPFLKEKYGCSNVCRKKDLPDVPGMIFAVPRMSYYLTLSCKVISIFLDFVSEEDLHVYSVDESFLNIGPYLKMYRCTAEELVARIQKTIWDKLGLLATAGIGPNMFLAKAALDNEGKKKAPYIAHWDYEDVPAKLWKIKPITKVWSISDGTSNHLARIGIRSLKELALAPIELLRKEFGIMGEQLKDLANGIDESDIQNKYVPQNRSLSCGQTLIRGYFPDEALLLLREMNDDLSQRLREQDSLAGKVSVYAGFEDGTSFNRSWTLPYKTDDTDTLYEAIEDMFLANAYNVKIRGIGISYGSFGKADSVQLSLFEDQDDQIERSRLNDALDSIHRMFGDNSALRASALLKGSTAMRRNEQIGGHRR